jgi:hypothetical protein
MLDPKFSEKANKKLEHMQNIEAEKHVKTSTL